MIAAADPRGDAVGCTGVTGAAIRPISSRAIGWLGEEGSSAVWRLSFARPPAVPDPEEPAFRVDILVHDPTIPALSFDDYRHVNRIVRFDATAKDAPLALCSCPKADRRRSTHRSWTDAPSRSRFRAGCCSGRISSARSI